VPPPPPPPPPPPGSCPPPAIFTPKKTLSKNDRYYAVVDKHSKVTVVTELLLREFVSER